MRLYVNVKYSLYTWKNHFFKSAFLLFQTLATMLILAYVFTAFFQYRDVIQNINGYISKGNIYKITSYDYEIELEDKDLNGYSRILDSIKKCNVKKMIMSNTYSFLKGEKELSTLQVDSNFFDVYNLSLDKKSDNPKDLFTLRSGDVLKEKNIPVYLGANYKKQYKIGEKVDMGDLKVKVRGFLKRGQTFVLPMQGIESISADDYIFLPYYVNEKSVEEVNDLIDSYYFVATDKGKLESITDSIHREKNNTYYYKNYRKQFEAINRDYKELFLQDGIVGIILLVFSMISILGMVYNIVEENEFEYGVSMMCGASKKDIFIRVLFHETLIFVLSFSVALLVFGFEKATLVLFGVLCLLIIAVCVYGFKVINVDSILKKIKGKE